MKLLHALFAAVLLCAGQLVWGQSITKAEYFFNTDPGIGKATPMGFSLRSSMLDSVLKIPTTGLKPGFHKLAVRTQDNSGVWSFTMAQNFFVFAEPVAVPPAAPIIGGEYFVNNDPGLGKAQAFQLDKNTEIEHLLEVKTEGLPPGFHRIGLRFLDAEHNWSHAISQNFYVFKAPPQPEMAKIVGGEYFFNADPGLGNAIPFEVKDPQQVSLALPVELPSGFHSVSFRLKDSLGVWSHAFSQSFYVAPVIKFNDPAKLVALEYEIHDSQGAFVAQNRMDYQPAFSLNENELLIPVNTLGEGTYTVTFRAIDSLGLKSMDFMNEFSVVDYGLTSFMFPDKQIDSTLLFDLTNKTVYVEIDPLADITALMPVFSLSDGAKLFYGETQLVSGQTALDFTFPLELKAVSSLGVEHFWNIEVAQRQLNDQKEILQLAFETPDGARYEAYLSDQSSYMADYNKYLDATQLKLFFTLSGSARLLYNGAVFQSGELVVDLSQPVEFEVIAENETSKIWAFSLELFDDNQYSNYMYLYNRNNGFYPYAYDLLMNLGLAPDAPNALTDIEILAPLSGEQNEFDFVANVAAPNMSSFVKIGSIEAGFINSFLTAEAAYGAGVETQKLSNLNEGDYFIVKLRDGIGYALVNVSYVYMTTNDDYDYIEFYYTKYYKTSEAYAVIADFEPSNDYGLDYLSVDFYNYSQNATQYSWDFDGDGQEDSSIENPFHEFTVPGEYNVRLIASNAMEADTAYWIVVVESSGGNCAGFMVDLYFVEGGLMAEATGGSGNYMYYLDDEYVPSSNGFFEGVLSGYHYVGVYDVETECAAYDDVEIEGLYADFEPDYYVWYGEADVYFYNYSQNATAFLWDFDGDGIDDSQDYEPSFVFAQPGEYTVRLIASDGTVADTVYRTLYVYEGFTDCDMFGVDLYSSQDVLFVDVYGGSGSFSVYLDGEFQADFDGSFEGLPYGFHYVEVYDDVYGCYAYDDYELDNPAEFFEYVMSIVDEFLIEIVENDLVDKQAVSAADYSSMVGLSAQGALLLMEPVPDVAQMETVMDQIGDLLGTMAMNPLMKLVTKVRLNTHEITIGEFDDPYEIKAFVEPVDASIKTLYWISDDGSIAEVIGGYVYPNGIGETVVYAFAAMGAEEVYDSCIVRVVPTLVDLIVPKNISLKLDEKVQIPVGTIPNNYALDLHWTSSDTSIALVYDGMIVPKRTGTVNIGVKDLSSGLSRVSMVTISNEIADLSAIKIEPDSATLKIGEGFRLSVSPVPANAKFSRLIRELSLAGIISQTPEGLITGVAEGQTVVTLTDSATGISAEAVIKVISSNPPKVREGLSYMLPQGSEPIMIDVNTLVFDDNTPLVKLQYSILPVENLIVSVENMQLIIAPGSAEWVGEELVQIVVEDRDGNKSLLSINIIVSDMQNEAPQIAEIYPQRVPLGVQFMPVNLFHFVNDDYSLLTKLAITADAGQNLMAGIADGILIVESANAGWVGIDSVLITVADEQGLSASRFVKYAVSDAPNQPPVFKEMDDQAMLLIDGLAMVDMSALISDDFTLPADIKWGVLGNINLNVDFKGAVATVSVVDENWCGTEILTFVATDSQGEDAYAQIAFLQEEPMNNTWTGKPVVDFSTNRTSIGAGTSLDFFGSITGGDADSWVWDFDGGEADDIYSLNPKVRFNLPGEFKVKLKAENDKGEDSLVVDKYVSVYGILAPDTVICEGASIELHSVSNGADEVIWNTGENTASILLSPVSDTVIFLTIKHGLAEYSDSVLIELGKKVDFGPDFEICENSGAMLSMPGYVDYQWSNGTTGDVSSIPLTAIGSYSLTATDQYGCVSSDEVAVIAVNPLPVFSLGDDVDICLNSSALLSMPEVAGHSYSWNTGAKDAGITVSEDGEFEGTVIDSKGCMFTDKIMVNVLRPYAEQIGLVTSSDDGQRVLVAWERSKDKRTRHYKILRETSVLNEYDTIGMLPFDSLSVFEDPVADAEVQSYRYKLVTVDSCGNEAFSEPHRTMHLQTSYSATDNFVNLDWTSYEGIEFSTYSILRGSSNDNLVEIGQVTSEQVKYTDKQPVQGMRYRVVVVLPDEIDPSALKTDTGPFSQSISNIAEVELVGLPEIAGATFAFAPNPTVDKLTVLLTNGLSGTARLQLVGTSSSISVDYEISQTETDLDLNEYPAGYYLAIITYKGIMKTVPLIIK